MNPRLGRAVRVASGYALVGAVAAFLPVTLIAALLDDPWARYVWFGGHLLAAAIGAGVGFLRVGRRGG